MGGCPRTVGVFVLDGSLAWRPGPQVIGLRHTLGASGAARKVPEERRSA